MTLRILVVSILALVLVNSCDDPKNSGPTHTVSGIISSGGLAKEGVEVSIDDALNWKTETDEAGYFEIASVSEGSHEIKAKSQATQGQFSERVHPIEVYGDQYLDSFILPSPISIHDPSHFAENSINLEWSPCDAPDFREYKLFRHISSGLDESTGTLIHISTSVNDTSFIDDSVDPLTEYFYRVYVMNEYGRLGGSNIGSIVTLNLQIILNGSFESIDVNNSFPTDWQVWNNNPYFKLDTSICYSGNNSMRADVGELDQPHHYLYQLIDPSLFTGDSRYKLSYQIRTSGMSSESNHFSAVLHSEPGGWYVHIPSINGPQIDLTWNGYEVEFTYPNGLSASNILIGFYPELPSEYQLWIDEISVIKI